MTHISAASLHLYNKAVRTDCGGEERLGEEKSEGKTDLAGFRPQVFAAT